jgi:AraC-like DNA-binding protein
MLFIVALSFELSYALNESLYALYFIKSNLMQLWQLRPHVNNYHFYRERRHFIRDESAFPSWVVLAAEEGHFRYRVQDEVGEAHFGDLIVCRPHLAFWRHAEATLSYHVISFAWVDAQGKPAHVEHEMKLGKITVADWSRLSSNFAYLRSSQGRVDAWSVERRSHVLRDILQLHFMQLAEPAAGAIPKDAVIAKAARHLRDNAHDVDMKSLSDSLGLSPVQFTRRFRKTMGTTPSEYLTSLRLHKARTLLLETDLTIQAVAERCGYGSGLYLSRVFSQHMKTSPGQFRKTHRV